MQQQQIQQQQRGSPMIGPDGSVVMMDRLVSGNSSTASVREYPPSATTTTTTGPSSVENPDLHVTSPQSPSSHLVPPIDRGASDSNEERRSSDPPPGESWFRSIFDHSPIQGLEPIPVDLSKRPASSGGDYLASVLSSMNELGSPGAMPLEHGGESSPPSYATQRPFVDDSHRLRYQDIEDETHSNEDSDEDDRRRPGNPSSCQSC